MTLTPWGDSSQLRARKLAPGYRLPPESVARNQRWRILAAMIAAVAEHGYERTAVRNVVELSGVSRTAFYRQFANKEDCFAVAVGEAIDFAMAAVRSAYSGDGSWDRRLLAAFDAFVEQIVEQPAAARACLIEVYVAGGAATKRADAGLAAFEQMVQASYDQSPRHAGLPAPVVRGIVGGVRKVVYTSLREDREAGLGELAPDLVRWALSYEAPAEALRRPKSRPLEPAPRPADDDQVERIFAALVDVVVEKGYQAMTLDDVAERAATSLSTFYSHFRTKRDAFLAAYDAGAARTYAAALPAYRRAPDWPHAVRAALEGMLTFLAREPQWAHAGVVEVLAAGVDGMERRDHAIATFAALLEPGYELAPEVPRLAADAIGGAVFDLLYEQVLRHGPARLPDLLPVTTFIALAPFVGSDRAVAVANERARRRPR